MPTHDWRPQPEFSTTSCPDACGHEVCRHGDPGPWQKALRDVVNGAFVDLSAKSSEWQAGWEARAFQFSPLSTWRGICGHVWDRAVEDTELCPRCQLAEAHRKESAGLDNWRNRAERAEARERLATALSTEQRTVPE
jgi:hypothetical protein